MQLKTKKRKKTYNYFFYDLLIKGKATTMRLIQEHEEWKSFLNQFDPTLWDDFLKKVK